MKIDLLEAYNESLNPLEDMPDSDSQEAEIASESENEKVVLWNGHFITPDAVFAEIENLAVNGDPETQSKVQDLVERLMAAGNDSVSEKNRLLILREIEVLAGGTKNEQGQNVVHLACAQKKGWIGQAAHKVAKFVKKHKVEIIVGIIIVAAIITVVVVVGGVAGGAAAAGGGALGGVGDDDKKSEPDSSSKGGPQPPPQKDTSCVFVTKGDSEQSCRIGGINGINTSYDDAVRHAEYLKRFTSDRSIEWVYDHSSGIVPDLAKAGAEYLGYSSKTGEYIQENWKNFYENNKDNPEAKYLQFCHSKGAIEIRNELYKTSQEIRDRIIVVAIAPAVVVPSNLCYESYNYVSKRDIVPHAELAIAGALETDEFGKTPLMDLAMENHEELIVLDPHPGATGIDHDFESPTYEGKIKDHIKEYIKNDGKYE